MDTDCTYKQEPIGSWLPQDFDGLLIWASGLGASDINLLPNSPIWVRIHGQWQTITQNILASDEIMGLVDSISSNPSASAMLKGGEDLDFAYEIKLNKIDRIRFRANATACRDGFAIGASLVMRTMPSLPPKLSELQVEQQIFKAAFPNNGLVLVTGVMGSGKSTLLASILRHIRETQPRHVLTYEHPIEFDLMSLQNPKGPLVQTEIPVHLSSFQRTSKNAARRAADVILVGESRDRETLRGMIEAAEIGVAAYSTVHTRSVAETPSRIINVFPDTMQHQVASTLISSLRLIVQQRLLPCTKGGRVPVKEWLVFDSSLRNQLFDTPITQFIPTIRQMVEIHGETLLSNAQKKYDAGLISKDDFAAIQHEQEALKHVA
ncbi:MAG: Flp pilus assembly complex ATPase component [Desulfobacteraceae bacterium]|nr:Flp pilus assembly complex ATPase component [Desulfobacteraceae bacterium]